MTGTSFAGGRGCRRKRNEKGLRSGRRRIFGNKPRRNGKRFSFFSYLEKTRSQLQTPKYQYGAILCKRRRKKCNFLKTMDVCFPCWEERTEPHQENRKGLRTFFVEHRNSSSAGNVPVENPRRGPRRGPCRDTGVELCPSVILQG